MVVVVVDEEIIIAIQEEVGLVEDGNLPLVLSPLAAAVVVDEVGQREIRGTDVGDVRIRT
jgi:hypothetical protein